MRKIITAVALAATLFVLPGCKQAEEFFIKAAEIVAKASDVIGKVQGVLVTTRQHIEQACREVDALEPQIVAVAIAAGVDMNSCKAATVLVKERAFVSSFCTGIDKLTDNVAGNYLTNVSAGLKRAKTAVAQGC